VAPEARLAEGALAGGRWALEGEPSGARPGPFAGFRVVKTGIVVKARGSADGLFRG
jgi:hypothetical protein